MYEEGQLREIAVWIKAVILLSRVGDALVATWEALGDNQSYKFPGGVIVKIPPLLATIEWSGLWKHASRSCFWI